MSGDDETSKSDTSEEERHHHSRKSTESLLNKELIVKCQDIDDPSLTVKSVRTSMTHLKY